MNTIKYFITLLVLVISNVAFADTILFDDFEDTPAYSKNDPRNVPFGSDNRPAGYDDGTQTPGVTEFFKISGHKSFGSGNARYDIPSAGAVSVRYLLPAGYVNRKIGFWMYATVASAGAVRVKVDSTVIAIFNFADGSITNTLKAEDWQYKEVNVPNSSSVVMLEIYGRNNLPQRGDPRLSNVFVDRVEVMGSLDPTLPSTSDLPLLTKDEARLFIAEACQTVTTCPLPDEYASCYTNSLNSLGTQSRIKLLDQTSLQNELDNLVLYCSGVLDGVASVNPTTLCSPYYDAGKAAGIASVDTESFRLLGFNAGVSSVDIEAIRQAGFAAGAASVDVAVIQQASFAAGVASVDTLSIQNNAFAQGVASIDVVGLQQAAFKAGVASVNVIEIQQQAFDAGMSSVDVAGLTSAARAEGLASCGQESFEDGLLTEKVTVHHRAGKSKWVSITISRNALNSHLGHGDHIDMEDHDSNRHRERKEHKGESCKH